MLFFSLFFLLAISEPILVNDTTPITINKNGEFIYEIDVGAEGVEFTFVKAIHVSFKGIQSDKSKLINIILNFHDDDYHNEEFRLSTENVRITFACDDPIQFSLKELISSNTDFSSTKPISANLTTSSGIQMDYTSFVNGFGPGCTLSGNLDSEGIYSDFNSNLEVQLPEVVNEITFSKDSMKIELESGEKDSFSNVFNKNFQIILNTNEDKDEISIDATDSTILGNVTIIGEKAIFNGTADFEKVTSAKWPIQICCEIIALPYETLPSGIFKFVDKDLNEKLDQVIMTKGVRSFCLYDGAAKCDVYGTIPLKYSSDLYVQSGKSISYVLCTSANPTIVIGSNAASSISINGSTTSNIILSVEDATAVTENISFNNVTVQFVPKSSKEMAFSIQNLYIGPKVDIKGFTAKAVTFNVAQSINTSFSFYLNEIYTDPSADFFSINIEQGCKIILYEFDNIAEIVIGDQDECFKVKYDDDEAKYIVFPNNDNRIVIYTIDCLFTIDPKGSKSPFANFELHVFLKDSFSDVLRIDFSDDWTNVESVIKGPIKFSVESNSYKNNIITMPFDQFPQGFVEYDEEDFVTYSTINTTLCLYNEGKDECKPVIGGRAVAIPSSGLIDVPKGTRYIFSADENVVIPDNLQFSLNSDSANGVGFKFAKYGKIKLSLSKDTLQYLSIEKVNFSCEAIGNKLTVADFVNHDSSFNINVQLSVTQSIDITVAELEDFEDKKYEFTGKMMKVIDYGQIKEIEFTEVDWIIELQNSEHRFTIDESKVSLNIESASPNVTFDVTENVKTLVSLNFTATGTDTIIYFTSRWIDPSISINSPIQLMNSPKSTAYLYHPFAYLESDTAKSFINYAPLIQDCPYQNTSICLSRDGTSNCGISNEFFIKAAVSEGSVYTIPEGHRFKVLLSEKDLLVSYDSASAKNVTIQSYDSSAMSLKLSIHDSMPSNMLLLLNDLVITFDTSSASFEWKLGSLDLFDTTFTTTSTPKLIVSGNCSVEMDVFYHMTKAGEGAFADGRFEVGGYLTLRDSNEEYLNEIKISSNSWTLNTSACIFTIGSSQFKNLIFGVNRPPHTNPRFIPLTLSDDLVSGQVAGNLNINIEEENLYLQIGNEWTKAKAISGRNIYIDATHDKGTSRFVYDNEMEGYISKFFAFAPNVNTINNKTCPICLLPSESFVTQCFQHELDMLPVISSDLNFLLDESRDYIIFGSPSTQYDFKYRTDIEYSVSVIAANKVTVKMNNAPSNVDFYFDSLIDDDGECDLVFESSKTLKSLKFDDSVRISTGGVENFKLTLDELTVDFKGFRRFFREPGIFSKPESIEVKGNINIVDDGRYNKIECGPDYWNLIGNENAWNTTFVRRSPTQRLNISTAMMVVNVSSVLPDNTSDVSTMSVSLYFQKPSATLNLEPSVCDTDGYVDGKAEIHSDQSLTVNGAFKYAPYTMFDFSGSFQYYKYAVTESSSLCLYKEGTSPCSIEGTKPKAVDPSKPFRIRCATKSSLVLTNTDVSLSFGEVSSTSIEIKTQSSSSEKVKASLSFGSVKLEKLNIDLTCTGIDLTFTDSNAALSFKSISLSNCLLKSNSDCTISDSFDSEFSALQLFTRQMSVSNKLELRGDSSFSSSVSSEGPKIICANGINAQLTNLASIFARFDYGYDSANKYNKVVFGTDNDDSKASLFTFFNLPVSAEYNLNFQSGKTVFANWVGGTSDSSLIPSFSYNFADKSELVVSSSSGEKWPVPSSASSSLIQVKTSFNELALTLNSPVALKLTDSSIRVTYKSLANLLNSDAYNGVIVSVLLQNDANSVSLGSAKAKVGGIEIPLTNAIKDLIIVHQEASNNLSVSVLSKAESISDVTLQMSGGTHLYLSKEFSSVSSGKVEFEKVAGSAGKATIYYYGEKVPSCISYDADGFDLVKVDGGGGDDDDDSGDKKKKMKPGVIAAIVITVIVVATLVVIGIVYFVKSRTVDITNYDYAPPLLELDSMKNQYQNVTL